MRGESLGDALAVHRDEDRIARSRTRRDVLPRAQAFERVDVERNVGRFGSLRAREASDGVIEVDVAPEERRHALVFTALVLGLFATDRFADAPALRRIERPEHAIAEVVPVACADVADVVGVERSEKAFALRAGEARDRIRVDIAKGEDGELEDAMKELGNVTARRRTERARERGHHGLVGVERPRGERLIEDAVGDVLRARVVVAPRTLLRHVVGEAIGERARGPLLQHGAQRRRSARRLRLLHDRAGDDAVDRASERLELLRVGRRADLHDLLDEVELSAFAQAVDHHLQRLRACVGFFERCRPRHEHRRPLLRSGRHARVELAADLACAAFGFTYLRHVGSPLKVRPRARSLARRGLDSFHFARARASLPEGVMTNIPIAPLSAMKCRARSFCRLASILFGGIDTRL
ncbi:MAG TPA: hypothetical protein VF407_22415 [Polyangiaceae bacterium]